MHTHSHTSFMVKWGVWDHLYVGTGVKAEHVTENTLDITKQAAIKNIIIIFS